MPRLLIVCYITLQCVVCTAVMPYTYRTSLQHIPPLMLTEKISRIKRAFEDQKNIERFLHFFRNVINVNLDMQIVKRK